VVNEQPWSDAVVEHGRILAVTDNPVSQALADLGVMIGREVRILADDSAMVDLEQVGLRSSDAVVLCDHDHPHRDQLLRLALTGPAGYVAMLGSRTRAQRTFGELARELPDEALAKLRVPAGLNIGGKQPGEIALSVLAEIVAFSHGRDGAPMRR
jgi:xanthine dehydrogenase accessory factor